MANSSDAYSPQRHATRAPVERRVRLQFEKSQAVSEGECRNISIGGMFVVGPCAGTAGETARFELGLDDGSAIRGLADVMWIRATDGGPGKEQGFGLKFKFLEQRDRQLIFKLVSRHIKDRLASRHPAPVQDAEPSVGDMVVPPVVARPTTPEPVAPEPSALEPLEPGQAVPEPSAPEPSAPLQPAPETMSSVSGEAERPSIFDQGEGLDSPSAPTFRSDPALPPDPALPSAPRLEGQGGQGSGLQQTDTDLPDDWDSDPTAFEIPKVTESEPAPSPEPQQAELSFAGVETTPGSPMAPAPLESEVDSLSNVFMKDQDFALDLPLDPKVEEEPELPLMTPMPSDAASDPYLQHLGEDHFDHRPVPKRDLPVLPIASLVLVLAAALGYLFSDQLFEWASADSPALEPRPSASSEQTAAPGSVYQAPNSSKNGDTSSASSASAGSTSAKSAPSEAQSQGASAPAQRSAPPSRVRDTGSQPRAADPPARSAAPQPAPPRSNNRSRGGRAFKALTDVTWRVEGQGLLLTVTVDGAASSSRVDHFRLDGDSPREVVRLLGVDKRAGLSTLQVGVGGVRQIRFGWHKKRRGNEIHLVLDMANRQSRVLSVRPEGNRFLVRIDR